MVMKTDKFNRLWAPGTPVMVITGDDHKTTGTLTKGPAENGHVRLVGFSEAVKINRVRPLIRGWRYGG